MQMGRWRALSREVARTRDLAVAPGADFLQFADRAIADQFAHAVEIRELMALCADLGGELVFVLEPGGADDAGFLHAIGQRLFAIDMFAAVHGPIGDKGVGVIQRAAIMTASISFCSRHLRQSTYFVAPGNLCAPKARCCSLISQRATTFSRYEIVKMSFRAAPSADQGDVQLVAGRVRAKKFHPRQDKSRCSGHGHGFEKLPAFDGMCRRCFGPWWYGGSGFLLRCVHGAILARGQRPSSADSEESRTTKPRSVLIWIPSTGSLAMNHKNWSSNRCQFAIRGWMSKINSQLRKFTRERFMTIVPLSKAAS